MNSNAEKRFVLRLAAKLQAYHLERYHAWEAEREMYHSQGYRAKYCEHGTYMWTDWDPMCPGCEDGHTMSDGVQRRRVALEEAKCRYRMLNDTIALQAEADRLGIRIATSELTSAYSRLMEV